MATRFQPFRSVRARLTLWNVIVLAIALVGAGLAFNYAVRKNLSATVDRQLVQGADGMQSFFGNTDVPEFRIDRILGIPNPNDDRSRRDRPGGRGPNDSRGGPPGGGRDRPDGPGRRGPGGPGGFAAAQRQSQAFGQLWPRVFRADGAPVQPDDKPWDPKALARALAGQRVFSTIGHGPTEMRVLSVPLVRAGKLIGASQWANSLILLRQEQRATTHTLLTLLPFVLALAALGGAFLTGRSLRPVRELARAAAGIGADRLSERLPVTGKDEFSDLAVTFNGMLSRLQDAFERMESAYEQHRRFTADASHELRTPLTIVKANASLALQSNWSSAQYYEAMQAVDAASDRMNRIVQDLLMLARADSGQLVYDGVPTPVRPVLEEAAVGVQMADYAPVTIEVLPEDLSVVGQSDALVRLFSNLLENAARHTPPDGKISVFATASDPSTAVITVADTGEGIAPEHLPHVMERFYRVDAARTRAEGGTGLGLSICESIVQAHGGLMEIASVVGKGTTVTVTLPRASKFAAETIGRNGHSAAAGRELSKKSP